MTGRKQRAPTASTRSTTNDINEWKQAMSRGAVREPDVLPGLRWVRDNVDVGLYPRAVINAEIDRLTPKDPT